MAFTDLKILLNPPRPSLVRVIGSSSDWLGPTRPHESPASGQRRNLKLLLGADSGRQGMVSGLGICFISGVETLSGFVNVPSEVWSSRGKYHQKANCYFNKETCFELQLKKSHIPELV